VKPDEIIIEKHRDVLKFGMTKAIIERHTPLTLHALAILPYLPAVFYQNQKIP